MFAGIDADIEDQVNSGGVILAVKASSKREMDATVQSNELGKSVFFSCVVDLHHAA